MRVNGIIAEYNPFHNGHSYQMRQSRALTGADYTVVVMSGNFVQRGAPALLDKHTRARMALLSGADLVLELPSIFAVSSAEAFAAGGVALLSGLGVVTHLCFGSESGDAALLGKVASVLAEEPDAYISTLKGLLRQGISYPSARTSALIRHCPELAADREIFASPNTILGIEYCKAILRQKSALTPVTTKRMGAGYHDRSPEVPCCSALAIRHALYTEQPSQLLKDQMPEKSTELLQDWLKIHPAMRCNHFSASLYYKLLSEREFGYEKYLDVSPDLSDRIRNRLNEFKSFNDFCDLLKTREMTYTRISRCLLHILLNLTKEDMACCVELGLVPYARVLGFRRDSAGLLSELKQRASIPLITKLADAEELLDEPSMAMLKQDIQTSQFYHGTVAGLTATTPANEYTIPLAIV